VLQHQDLEHQYDVVGLAPYITVALFITNAFLEVPFRNHLITKQVSDITNADASTTEVKHLVLHGFEF